MPTGVLLRIWRTGLDPQRVDEYDRFAREISAPMFRQQPGWLGLTFARSSSEAAVITRWASHEAVEALATSASYQTTAARLQSTGLLSGQQTVELFEVTDELQA